mgnify:CR=1 FL=1
MATYQTYTAIGQREDLSDVIYNISPTETPFMSSVGKSKATLRPMTPWLNKKWLMAFVSSRTGTIE